MRSYTFWQTISCTQINHSLAQVWSRSYSSVWEWNFRREDMKLFPQCIASNGIFCTGHVIKHTLTNRTHPNLSCFITIAPHDHLYKYPIGSKAWWEVFPIFSYTCHYYIFLPEHLSSSRLVAHWQDTNLHDGIYLRNLTWTSFCSQDVICLPSSTPPPLPNGHI